MSIALHTEDGARAHVPTSAPADVTEEQMRLRRFSLWLDMTEKGCFDWISGRIRPYTPTEIAGLFAVSVRTVQLGLAAARRLRDDLRRATDGDDTR